MARTLVNVTENNSQFHLSAGSNVKEKETEQSSYSLAKSSSIDSADTNQTEFSAVSKDSNSSIQSSQRAIISSQSSVDTYTTDQSCNTPAIDQLADDEATATQSAEDTFTADDTAVTDSQSADDTVASSQSADDMIASSQSADDMIASSQSADDMVASSQSADDMVAGNQSADDMMVGSHMTGDAGAGSESADDRISPVVTTVCSETSPQPPSSQSTTVAVSSSSDLSPVEPSKERIASQTEPISNVVESTFTSTNPAIEDISPCSSPTDPTDILGLNKPISNKSAVDVQPRRAGTKNSEQCSKDNDESECLAADSSSVTSVTQVSSSSSAKDATATSTQQPPKKQLSLEAYRLKRQAQLELKPAAPKLSPVKHDLVQALSPIASSLESLSPTKSSLDLLSPCSAFNTAESFRKTADWLKQSDPLCSEKTAAEKEKTAAELVSHSKVSNKSDESKTVEKCAETGKAGASSSSTAVNYKTIADLTRVTSLVDSVLSQGTSSTKESQATRELLLKKVSNVVFLF